MSTSGPPAHPLAALVGPLRYACARDFLNLAKVKDLRTPLDAALERAKGGAEAGHEGGRSSAAAGAGVDDADARGAQERRCSTC